MRFLGEPDAVVGIALLKQDKERELVISFEQSLGSLQHDVLCSSERPGGDDVS